MRYQLFQSEFDVTTDKLTGFVRLQEKTKI